MDEVSIQVTPRQAIEILTNVTADVPLRRADHVVVLDAIAVLTALVEEPKAKS